MNNLSDMKKNSPFKVPKNYFGNVSDRVMEKIEKEDAPSNKNIIMVLKPYMWMAASIIGLVLFVKLIITSSVPSEFRNQQLTQIEDTNSTIIDIAEPELYFDNMSEITSDEIIEYLSNYELETDDLLANL